MPKNLRLGILAGYPFTAGPKLIIKQFKLEYGTKYTIGRKIGNVIVPNDPIPNKSIELSKCQRYYFKSQNFYVTTIKDAWRIPLNIPFGIEMGIRPACIVWSSKGRKTLTSPANGQQLGPTGVLPSYDNLGVMALYMENEETNKFVSGIGSGWIIASAEL